GVLARGEVHLVQVEHGPIPLVPDDDDVVRIGADDTGDPGEAAGRRGEVGGRIVRTIDRRQVDVILLVAVLVLEVQDPAAVARPRERIDRAPRVRVDGAGVIQPQRAKVNGAATPVGRDPTETRSVRGYRVPQVAPALAKEVGRPDRAGGGARARGEA